jgi:hypothetical protein
MANKDLFKQAIAEAKSVREAAIANAKEALEETLTPHLKDMLAAKLQEMEDKTVEEEVVNEIEEEIEEAKDDKKDEAIEEELTEVEPVGEAEEDEAEDDSEESEDEAEDEIEDAGDDAGEEDAVEGDEDLGDLSVDQFKDMIRDIIAQELGQGGEEEMGADMDAGDIEGMGDEAPIEEPEMGGGEEEEIDLDELLAELEAISEEEVTEEEVTEGEEVEEGKKDKEMEEDVNEGDKKKDEAIEEETSNQVPADAESKEDHAKNINRTIKEDLDKALETIESLQTDLQEVNLLNSKLLYVNKIFKANNLNESQKVNVIAAFDKAETVKEVKLVFETVSESGLVSKKETVSENKVKGMASKATGTTATKPGVINEASEAVTRMQILAGIKPRQF